MADQECNWHVPTAKMTDLTREMRHMGIVGDGYMNFKDMMRGYRKSKGLPTWDQLKPLVGPALLTLVNVKILETCYDGYHYL